MTLNKSKPSIDESLPSLPHNHLQPTSALPYLHCHQAVDGRVLREGGTSAFLLSERKRCDGERRKEYCGWMVDVRRHPKKINHSDELMAICGGAFRGVSHGQPSSHIKNAYRTSTILGEAVHPQVGRKVHVMNMFV